MVVNPSFPAKPSPSSSPTPRPIPARSTWRRPATAARPTSPASCSSSMTGIDMVHVPYRGQAPAIADLLGGQVQVLFASSPASMEHIKSRQAQGAGRHHRGARGGAARPADRGRFRAGLRGERLVRRRRPAGKRPPRSSTGSTRRSTRPRRPQTEGAAGRSRRHADFRLRPPISASSSPTKPRSGARVIKSAGIKVE